MIRLQCQLRDCMHYHLDSAGEPWCQCSHPEKQYYMEFQRCPLYRLDWSKQEARADEVISRMRNRIAG